MKAVLLIGMGKFGCILGEKLIGMGDEVVAVDKNEEIIDTIAPLYTDARIMNCMIFDHLKTLDVSAFDVCVVSIAEDFQASLEITSNLKDLGAKRVRRPKYTANFWSGRERTKSCIPIRMWRKSSRFV